MRTAAILPLLLLPTSYAWTFTWRNANGEKTTEKGTGPSDCITVNHAEGQLFVADGEGEPNINMLLFTTPDCSGEPAGRATKDFSKESSVDILGFQVVPLGTTTSGTATATKTATETDTETATSGSATRPTPSPSDSQTPTTTATTATSTTSTEAETATESETTAPTPSTDGENAASETESTAETPAPTDASSKLMLSGGELARIAVGLAVGMLALDYLF